MKQLLAIFTLLLLVGLVGNGENSDLRFPDKWHSTVRLDVNTSDDDPIVHTIKGYLLAELRKIPDITVVGENEVFLISIVPIETSTSIIMSICYLRPHRNGYIKSGALKLDDGETKFLEVMTTGLYSFEGQSVSIFPKHQLEEKCRELVVNFDAKKLQPGREWFQKRQR